MAHLVGSPCLQGEPEGGGHQLPFFCEVWLNKQPPFRLANLHRSHLSSYSPEATRFLPAHAGEKRERHESHS
jgi:hypothetical protein